MQTQYNDTYIYIYISLTNATINTCTHLGPSIQSYLHDPVLS